MKFGIILSVATLHHNPGERVMNRYCHEDLDPRRKGWFPRGTWRLTQSQDISEDTDNCLGQERTYVSVVDADGFCRVCDEYDLYGQSLCETGGAMGMPGAEPWYSMMPAWCLQNQDSSYSANIYFTPYPDIEVKTGISCSKKNIKRILDWVQKEV